MKSEGMKAIIVGSVMQIVRRPIYWVAMFVVPLFAVFFFSDILKNGMPVRVPAGIVDFDHSAMSRSVKQNLEGMQMVKLVDECNDFTEARKKVQSGDIYGFFMIPENFQSDLISGRSPVISFYTNMTYYVPASLLYKTFKTTAVYTKAGVAMKMLENRGASPTVIAPIIQPVDISVRGLHNPEMNYAVYLCNSFVPALLQLMIFLVTSYSLSVEIKYGTSVNLLRQAGGSIVKTVAGRLLPQTIIWWIMILFMESWLFKWSGFPMNGSWWWMTLSELMFVVAAQGFAIFFTALLCNMRFALSVCALIGVLSFSVAAFSLPYESMYGAIGIFSWILPTRYNFLIYIDQALNGVDIYYSRYYFVAYILFMLAPFTVMWKLKRAFQKPIYIP